MEPTASSAFFWDTAPLEEVCIDPRRCRVLEMNEFGEESFPVSSNVLDLDLKLPSPLVDRSSSTVGTAPTQADGACSLTLS